MDQILFDAVLATLTVVVRIGCLAIILAAVFIAWAIYDAGNAPAPRHEQTRSLTPEQRARRDQALAPKIVFRNGKIIDPKMEQPAARRRPRAYSS